MDSAIANRQRIEQLPCIAHKPEDLETLLDAGSFRERLHQEITQAKQRIYLVALYLQDDDAGRGILTALYEAKQANPDLDIKVLVDWHRAQRGLIGAAKSDGNAALYREFAESYEHQIDVLGVPVRNREVFGVLHLKGFVIDDKVIYSGASLNDVYLAQHQRYRYDRYHVIQNAHLADSMAKLIKETLADSDAVNCLSQAIRPETKALKGAIKDLRNQLQRASYSFSPESVGSDQVGLTPLIGLGKRKNKLNQHICTLIASAQKELTICTPYFNFPRLISREVKRAIRRGVKVTIVVGDKTANDFYIPPNEPFKTIAGLPYLYEVNLRNFAKQNEGAIARRQLAIHLWKHNDNSFHLKGIWVDRSYMLITGNNLNPRAWKLDLENAILVHDKSQLLAEQKQKELDCILSHTQLVGSYKFIEKVDTYPAPVRKLIKRIRRIKADHILNQIL
ncbi:MULTISPECIES: CDP-diacylglycerol--serine O-phosphatidyltransferase [Photobacterium]|uniref:CDP-diacylglycerol--serine O-phosphatidyltransferase n=1 Tax=Photobacterium alginatilyticum TaxID=1775171 RepID=A0ABW9YQJ8_9GAMM|nr:CDP-diacylglycerol--serine O-phosphatidyltransferase [Photobacterium alginatilyticum]NBI56229.1 CDP-diacylglycerol--serine O-phosphatidyltransferase [Photobacterium alginatilyticum]